jgi:hypothetical protein
MFFSSPLWRRGRDVADDERRAAPAGNRAQTMNGAKVMPVGTVFNDKLPEIGHSGIDHGHGKIERGTSDPRMSALR